jgi:2-oxoglutarate dehydrogenase E2 component (dihydrolipoamide succinyltransferase)
MARQEMVMPKMGESIMEGTVIEWKKKVGDTVQQDETVLEIATDKVDSEVPAPIAGVLVEILVQEGETVEVGTLIAIIDTDANATVTNKAPQTPALTIAPTPEPKPVPSPAQIPVPLPTPVPEPTATSTPSVAEVSASDRFYSPLVKSIAKKENISMAELNTIQGTGAQGRVSKEDLMNYIISRKDGQSKAAAPAPTLSRPEPTPAPATVPSAAPAPSVPAQTSSNTISAGEIKVNWPSQNVEIIKMDRMRKLIAEHMVKSKQTSAHVTTFGEADVTKLVMYREKNKERFFRENGFKLTFTPFFVEATIQAIREFPLINSSVDGDNIILKRDINYGIAVALGESGSGGLIVPVIKNAGEMNLIGLARSVNELARKARNKTLSPDDLTGGTYTLTNYGSVGNLMGTPIINQPQVAIFGTGAIVKRPMVLETDHGDVIAVRHMVYLSMSYDHRIIDGALGGAFLQRVKTLLEDFDDKRTI